MWNNLDSPGPRRFLAMLAVALAFALPLTAAPAIAQEKKYAHEFYHDFRGNPLPNEIHVVGKPHNEFIKEEPAGFRITLPKTWIHEFGGVGCKTNFTIKGDFEATGTFEILHADEPPKGFGVGTSLRVQLGQPDPRGTTLARAVRAGPNQILIWDHGPMKDGKFVGGVAKCSDKLLRLRFKREGATLHYQWAPGLAGDNFEDIRAEKNFGEDDVIAVRMNVFTGREPCNVDVRFLDLRIRSGGLVAKDGGPVAQPNNAANPPEGAPKTRSTLLIAALVGIGLTVLVLSAIGITLLKRRAGRTEPTASEPAPIVFQCTACGKTLKAQATTAGKKIKCVKCGQATLVPATEAT